MNDVPKAIEAVWKIDRVHTAHRRRERRLAAAYDGNAYAVVGIPGVDHVRLRKVDDVTAEATFSLDGKPVFGYRSIRARDGRSLTIVSIDPVTRTPLSSVVVYDAH
jgi:hypothetical protein